MGVAVGDLRARREVDESTESGVREGRGRGGAVGVVSKDTVDVGCWDAGVIDPLEGQGVSSEKELSQLLGRTESVG